MFLRPGQPQPQIVGGFRRIEQVRIHIQLVNVHQHQRLGLVQAGHDILVIPVLHDESVILHRGQVGHKQLHLIVAGHGFGERLAACRNILLGHTTIQQRLLGGGYLILRILQL